MKPRRRTSVLRAFGRPLDRPGRALIAVVAFTLLRSISPAQTPNPGAAEGFESTDYFADNPTQLKLRVKSDKFAPAPGEAGTLLLTGMTLEYFQSNGLPAFTVTAPECAFSIASRSATSPGTIHIQVGANDLSIEGRGFFWQEANSTNAALFLSNEVHAVVQRPPLNRVQATNLSTMDIRSTRFTFDLAQRMGVFDENVHAEDPELLLRCGSLTVRGTEDHADDHNGFNTLSATRDVQVTSKMEGRTAHGDNALYTQTNGLMTLTGNVSWQQGAQSGRADLLRIQTLSRDLQADGHVAAKMPRGTMAMGTLLDGATPPKSATALDTGLVDLQADRLTVQSNQSQITITGKVRLQDGPTELSCDNLAVENHPTNAARTRAVATGHVAICRSNEVQCLRSGRLVYTKSDETALFTEEPTWNLPQSVGRADQVSYHKSGDLDALGNVRATVTMTGQTNAALNFFPDSGTSNLAPRSLELSARELHASDRKVTLRGQARIQQSPFTGREPRLECEHVEVTFHPNAHRMESLWAEGQVRYQQGESGGAAGSQAANLYRSLIAEELRAGWNEAGTLSQFSAQRSVVAKQAGDIAKGDQATLNPATGEMVLTGHTSLDSERGSLVGADRVIWNRQTGHWSASGGNFEIKSRSLNGIVTNLFKK